MSRIRLMVDGKPQWSENDPGYRARSAGYLARASSGGVLLTDVVGGALVQGGESQVDRDNRLRRERHAKRRAT